MNELELLDIKLSVDQDRNVYIARSTGPVAECEAATAPEAMAGLYRKLLEEFDGEVTRI